MPRIYIRRINERGEKGTHYDFTIDSEANNLKGIPGAVTSSAFTQISQEQYDQLIRAPETSEDKKENPYKDTLLARIWNRNVDDPWKGFRSS